MSTDQFINDLAKDAKPVKPLPSITKRLSIWLFIAVTCIAIGVQFFGFRSDWQSRLQDPFFFFEAAATIAVGIMAAASAFVLSVPGQELKGVQRWGIYMPIVAWFILLIASWFLGKYSFKQGLTGFGCSIEILTLGVLPGVVLFTMIKSAAPVRLGWAGTMMILGVLALSAVGVQFTCTFNNPIHLLLTHFMPVMVLGLFGIILGRWVLKW